MRSDGRNAAAHFDVSRVATRREVEGCGLVVAPENSATFAGAIETLLDNRDACSDYAVAARDRAEDRWAKTPILGRFAQQLASLLGSEREVGLRAGKPRLW